MPLTTTGLKLTDASGALVTQGEINALDSSVSYLNGINPNAPSPLVSSENTTIVFIHDGDDRSSPQYDSAGNISGYTVYWDPDSAHAILNDAGEVVGVQSPALGLGHEWDGHGSDPAFATQVQEQAETSNQAEAYAINVENGYATGGGEPTRTDNPQAPSFHDSFSIYDPNDPTEHTSVGADGAISWSDQVNGASVAFTPGTVPLTVPSGTPITIPTTEPNNVDGNGNTLIASPGQLVTVNPSLEAPGQGNALVGNNLNVTVNNTAVVALQGSGIDQLNSGVNGSGASNGPGISVTGNATVSNSTGLWNLLSPSTVASLASGATATATSSGDQLTLQGSSVANVGAGLTATIICPNSTETVTAGSTASAVSCPANPSGPLSLLNTISGGTVDTTKGSSTTDGSNDISKQSAGTTGNIDGNNNTVTGTGLIDVNAIGTGNDITAGANSNITVGGTGSVQDNVTMSGGALTAQAGAYESTDRSATRAGVAFRNPTRVLRFLGAGVCLGIGLIGAPVAASAQATSDDSPYPLIRTWKRILATLNSPDGRITAGIIEKNFHTTLTPDPSEPPSAHPTDFVGLDGLDHLVQVAFSEPSPSKWRLVVGWVHDNDIPPGRLNTMVAPTPVCVASEMVESDLLASGWVETYPLRRSGRAVEGPMPPGAGFKKGPDNMSISFSKDYRCMAGLTAGNYP